MWQEAWLPEFFIKVSIKERLKNFLTAALAQINEKSSIYNTEIGEKGIDRFTTFFFLWATVHIQISSPAHLENIWGRRVPRKKCKLWCVCMPLKRTSRLFLKSTSIFSRPKKVVKLCLSDYTVPKFNEIKAERTSQPIVSLPRSIPCSTHQMLVLDTWELFSASYSFP